MEQGEALRMLRAVLLWGRGSLVVPPSLPALLSDSVWEGTVWCIGRLPGREPELRDSFFYLLFVASQGSPRLLLLLAQRHPLFSPASSSNPYIPLHWLRSAAQRKTVKMSGYQGKKNIPRITVSVGLFLALEWLRLCPVGCPVSGPAGLGAGCHRGGGRHGPCAAAALLDRSELGAEGYDRPSCSLKCIVQMHLGLIVKSALLRPNAR